MVITGLQQEHHEFGDSQSKITAVLPELVQTQRLQSSRKFRHRVWINRLRVVTNEVMNM